jgi:peroxiredoxin
MAAEVGQTAPDFTLYDTDRKQRSLSEFKGKNVILAFFPGAFTGVCNSEACAFRDRTSELDSLNAQVVGITVDSAFSQKAWMDHNKASFTVLSDFTREVVNAYDVALPNFGGMEGYVAANRAVLVIDKDGIIRYRWMAPNPGVEPDYDEVRQAVAALG